MMTEQTVEIPKDQLDLENRYYRFLRQKGYSSSEALHSVLEFYLPYFRAHRRVLDIGCGHGEFLQLLADMGSQPVGIDIDPGMVESCRAGHLEAHLGDVLTWLPAQSEPFDAIFSSNVMEHLPPQSVANIVRLAFDALRPGGMLLIGVPNPESAIVQFHEFWRDPTHVRLYDRQLLEFFLVDAGFVQVQSGENEAARWEGIDEIFPPHEVAASGLADFDLDRWAPLPTPPDSRASWRERIAFRVSQWVFSKFLEPYSSPIREALALEVEFFQSSLQAAEQRLNGRIQLASRALYTSREVFVYGYKPADE